MKRMIAAAALILSLAGGAAAEGTVKTKTPAASPLHIAALLRFTPPKGWSVVEYSNAGGADPVLRFEDRADAVQIRVFGAPGSDYRTPKDFLAGPAATEMGAAPAAKGEVSVAGNKLTLYRRRYPIESPNPHGPAAPNPLMGTELFCVLPLKSGRFAVFAYRRASPIPDLKQEGEKAWAAFLKTLKPR